MKNPYSPRLILLSLVCSLSMGCASIVTQPLQVDSADLIRERHIQRTIALEQNSRDSNRLFDVSFPLLESAVTFCGQNTKRAIGLDVATIYDYAADFQRAAKEVLLVGDRASVIGMVTDGPAEKAGIRTGDIITSINGTFLINGENATSIYHNLLDSELEESSDGQVTFAVERSGEDLQFTIQSVMKCDYPVVLVVSDDLNAYADGSSVFLTRRMLRFAENDQELALVISHELAHNIMEHIEKTQQNSWFGAVIDYAISTQGFDTEGFFGTLTGKVFSQSFETEADYVGMYILATTGIDLDGATYFWRRMAVESPGNIDGAHTTSHPASAERFLALEKAVEEINYKRINNQELVPEMKGK